MYKSIANNVAQEIKVNKSKFIAHLIKADDEDKINDEIKKIKLLYKDADQYCYAYIIDNVKRYSDDKEPTGTAGIPILETLIRSNLNHILCIVVRYCNGCKLGTGGLLRAYTQATKDVIKKANRVNFTRGKIIEITFDYQNIKKIDNLLKDITIIDKKFNELITYKMIIELEKIDDIKLLLNNISNLKLIELNELYIEHK
jgi:uncharacterized YigZ family protein